MFVLYLVVDANTQIKRTARYTEIELSPRGLCLHDYCEGEQILLSGNIFALKLNLRCLLGVPRCADSADEGPALAESGTISRSNVMEQVTKTP